MQLYYAIALLIAFYVMLIAEFFLPTGGLLGAGAVAALAATIVIAFTHSTLAGIVITVFALATTPLVLIGMVHLWPHTPIGRRMLNRRPGQLAEVARKRTTSDGRPIDELVGRIGTAKTDLLPSGMILIEGKKIDAVSTGMPIDAGTPVMVTSTEAGRVHVRPVSDEEVSRRATPPTPQSPPALEESLESFDFE